MKRSLEKVVLKLNELMKTMTIQWQYRLVNRLSLDSTYGTANMFYLNTQAPLKTNKTLKLLIDPHVPAAVKYCCLCDAALKDSICIAKIYSGKMIIAIKIIYLMNINSVTYVEKNHINCEWLDGIPNSVPMWTRLIGRGSLIQCFNITLLISFTRVPIKNAICPKNNNC